MMNREQRTAFFDGIIAKLQADGTLRPFDVPKGEPTPQSSLMHYGYTGQIRHIGDEPYTMLSTTVLQRHVHDLSPSDLGLKSTSIRLAIARYMPDDAFAQYLDSFVQNVEDDHTYASVRRSLYDTMPDQLLRTPVRKSSKEIADVIRTAQGEHVLGVVGSGEYMDRLSRYPELVTALGIYHAAHREYLHELTEAVDASTTLTREEQQVAIGTLHSLSFQQFDSFLLFASVLPLAVFYYEQGEQAEAQAPVSDKPKKQILPGASTEARWENPVDHTRMKEAIGKAWNTVFERDLMMRHYNAEGQLPEAGKPWDRRMVCPARNHLKAAKADMQLERIYDHVVAHPKSELLESGRCAIDKMDHINRLNRERGKR